MSDHLFELEALARLHVAELHQVAAEARLIPKPSSRVSLRHVTARALFAAGTAIGGHDLKHASEPAALPAPLPRERLPVAPT